MAILKKVGKNIFVHIFGEKNLNFEKLAQILAQNSVRTIQQPSVFKDNINPFTVTNFSLFKHIWRQILLKIRKMWIKTTEYRLLFAKFYITITPCQERKSKKFN